MALPYLSTYVYRYYPKHEGPRAGWGDGSWHLLRIPLAMRTNGTWKINTLTFLPLRWDGYTVPEGLKKVITPPYRTLLPFFPHCVRCLLGSHHKDPCLRVDFCMETQLNTPEWERFYFWMDSGNFWEHLLRYYCYSSTNISASFIQTHRLHLAPLTLSCIHSSHSIPFFPTLSFPLFYIYLKLHIHLVCRCDTIFRTT